MSRSSQKDYLSKLMAKEEEEDTSSEPRTPVSIGSPLLTRANSLGRIASGELKQVPQVRLDPKRCRIWTGNGRLQSALNYDRCKDLIESMIAEGGQKMPALVRKLRNDPDHDYEVIYGTRRHWAISWLRENNYPDFVFLAEVRDINDEAAFRLADLENRTRSDISELERARNYAEALPIHYEGKQARMAERLNISKGWLSKLIAFAQIKDGIIAAFKAPGELSLRQGYALAQAISSSAAEKRALDEAKIIARLNAEHLAAGKAPFSTQDTLSRLLKAAEGKGGEAPEVRDFLYKGKPVVTMLGENRKGIRLHIHHGTGAGLEEVVQCLTDALRASGFGNKADE
ncbi:ParB/RepB/Spo0J family partition protein [Acidocella facilis]|uniref:ParB/RepB/Spo0J family partition protein n=1 Tax=Acidocella facilis TaxID=525 RepID=UPI001F2A662E|nr:ParB/RepB/Spo0J family partition protein [Acidocella facilis]